MDFVHFFVFLIVLLFKTSHVCLGDDQQNFNAGKYEVIDGLTKNVVDEQDESEEREISPPPIIPRKVMFADADYAVVRLSPDGRWLAWIAPYDNVPNIWGKDLPDGEPKPWTKEKGRGITSFSWTYRNHTIIYSQDKDGDENWRIIMLNTQDFKTRFLTETFGVRAAILASSSRMPNNMVIGLNNRDPRYHDAYMIDLESGNETLLFLNTGFKSYQFDAWLNIRLLCNETEDAGEAFYLYRNSTFLEHFRTVSFEASDFVGPLFFRNKNVLYWLDSKENDDQQELQEINLETGNVTVIHRTKYFEIAAVVGNPVISIMENYKKPTRIFLQPNSSLSVDLAHVKRFMPDLAEPLIVSHSSDFKIWLIVPIVDNTPPSYYFFNRTDPERRVKFLFNYKQTLKSYSLVPMHAFEIEARDGLKLVSYLTLPLESDPKFTGLPKNPLPTVLLVHGGPWSRDKWGFDEQAQYYANRGYAVLQVNFRGSSGFGKEFLNAGYGQWGLAMQDDLIDAVNWSIQNNISIPHKIAIVGKSYGGYAVLAGLAFTPKLFACGVDIVGPSNLISLIRSIPPYWKPAYRMFRKKLGGDPSNVEDQKFFKRISPFYHAHKIERPLLIAQGANDPKVRKFESDQIVEALRNQSVAVTYLLFPDEGHTFVRWENRLAFYAIAEQFLAQCLGGRVEPTQNDVAQSSVQIT